MLSAICRNLSSVFFSMAACRFSSSFAFRISSVLGRQRTRGTTRTSSAAVDKEARAVITFTPPEIQYSGSQSVTTSIKCVAPQAAMKVPKQTNIQSNGRFSLFLYQINQNRRDREVCSGNEDI